MKEAAPGPAGPRPATISVIIPTYGRPTALKAAMQSLAKQRRLPDELIVALWDRDRASLSVLEDQATDSGFDQPKLKLVRTDENTVAAKENAAIQAATGDVICFMDDDAIAPPDWLQRLEQHYADPMVGAVGGRDVIRSWTSREAKRTRAVGRVSWFGRLTANHHEPTAGVRDVDFLKGCNMSFRRELVSPVDPRLVGEIPYGFEIDMGLAVRAQGRRLVYDPEASVDHYPSSNMSANEIGIARVSNHNQTYILLKHLAWWQRIAFLLYTFLLGDRNTIGLLRIPWLLWRRRWSPAMVKPHFAGKATGLRCFLDWRRAAARRQSGMRILVYTHPFRPQVGGLERLSERTARQLHAAGLHVVVVTDTKDEMPGGDENAFPFSVVRRPSVRVLASLIRKSEVVQLNGFDISVFALATLMRRPIVWQHIDYDTVDPRGICTRYGRSCTFSARRCWSCLRTDHSLSQAGRVIASFFARVLAARAVKSNLVSSRYAAQRLCLPAMEVLPLGVDRKTFERTCVDRNQEPFSLLFFGRLIAHKGTDLLIEALAVCRQRGLEVNAVIAGAGPHRPLTEALARKLSVSDSVIFTGLVSDDELASLITQADAVVVPSTCDEYYNFVSAEAMSCGTPVIASNLGALPEIVGDGGLLFEPGDALGLADSIQALAQDADLRQRVRTRARSRAQNTLSEDLMIQRYLRVYQQVTGAPA